MANIIPTPSSIDPLSEGEVRVERVGPRLQRMALGMLLAGQPSPNDPAVDPFLSFAHDQKLDLTDLWAVWRNDVLVGACLIVPSPGRTAMLFVSPAKQPDPDPALVRVIQAALAAQNPSHVQMVQCLLNLEQTPEAHALTDAGLTSLATLFYMSRPTLRTATPLTLDPDIEVVQWSESHRPRFADAILKSYEDTRDCPGLLGLRTLDDIMAGHMATGTFDPTLWWALHQHDQPVGVMLLSKLSHQNAGELVYLGLAPAFRGRGLSRTLLQHGMGVLGERKIARILLAVDRDNEPAIGLYRSLRFTVTHQKAAFIFTLK